MNKEVLVTLTRQYIYGGLGEGYITFYVDGTYGSEDKDTFSFWKVENGIFYFKHDVHAVWYANDAVSTKRLADALEAELFLRSNIE